MKALSFDDVLIVDKFSTISSRKDVDPSVELMGVKLSTPMVSSNMTCVTDAKMAKLIREHGALGCLPRFWSVEDNVKAFRDSPKETFVSVGLGEPELERAIALFEAGASGLVIDVAQGASAMVVAQTKAIRQVVKTNAAIMVGNFSNLSAFSAFQHSLGERVDAIKVGIGGGSACITRVVTGCGMPTLASIIDLRGAKTPMVADGGIRTSGDMVKAIAAGATAVMCGRLFAACDESPAITLKRAKWDTEAGYAPMGVKDEDVRAFIKYADRPDAGVYLVKKYSGSASSESYEAQGKVSSWRAPEGESYWVNATGSVQKLIETFDGGLRSAMTYNNARTIDELRKNVEFIEVTASGSKENSAHGKT
jgi:IMP dehydrogenase